MPKNFSDVTTTGRRKDIKTQSSFSASKKSYARFPALCAVALGIVASGLFAAPNVQAATPAPHIQSSTDFQISSVSAEKIENGYKFTFNGGSKPIFAPYSPSEDVQAINLSGMIADSLQGLPETDGSIQLELDTGNSTGKIQVLARGARSIETRATNTSLIVYARTVEVEAQQAESSSVVDQLTDLLERPRASIVLSDEAQTLADDFSFSKYTGSNISLDYHKADLHNVLRSLQTISGANLVIDESVNGSLSILLNDVPWDFALELILRVKRLEKIERFNTIIVYDPSEADSATFENWVDTAEDNLEFEADTVVLKEDALVIQESEKFSASVLEAKKLMRLAEETFAKKNYHDSADLYERAAEIWPEDLTVKHRLSEMYLTYVKRNDRALFFAKQALERSPDDRRAALYAAIAAERLHRTSEARSYFKTSIDTPKPMSEALQSYAAFCETYDQPKEAVKLLDLYITLYGATPETLLAKARVLDSVGMKAEATATYNEILSAGYQIPVSLREFIAQRAEYETSTIKGIQ